jgi:ligand-binding SRPBCC domain-containing protein
MPVLEASVSIGCSAEKVFDFLTQSANFMHLVPQDLKLTVLKAPTQLELGSRLEVQILAFGPPQNVIYEITDFSRPDRFTETQVKGILPRYVHEHVLATDSNGSVLVTDRIEFEPPGGLMGFMLTPDRLKTSLDRGLSHRHSALKRLLENA